jgi:choline dehydrogenase
MRVVVVGGGTGGCAFAGTLARTTGHDVVLLEAGHDFGPFEQMRWPFELLDSRRIPLTHDWGLLNEDPGTNRRYNLWRAKVLGGCSAHNGCSAVRGLRADFDQWAEVGGAFWAADKLLEDFRAVEAALRVRSYRPDEITPFQQDVHAAALACGFPNSADINDIDEGEGASVCPVNKVGGVRWNAAFAFLDPVRDRGNFSILDDFEATELRLDGNRVVGVRGLRRGAQTDVDADMVVLGAGAYGSPILLLRSGIGDPALLRAAGIAPRHDLPGVGQNLQDHPCAVVGYAGRPELIERMQAFERTRLAFDEGIIVKARSPASAWPVDIHIFSCGGRSFEPAGWYWQLWVGLLTPYSRGEVRPVREGGELRFTIAHNHGSDREGRDLAALAWGVETARRMAASDPLRAMLAEEVAPGAAIGRDGLADWIRATHVNYFHPAGTCAIGKDPRQGAVVDEMCRVHGLKGLMVADASVMPNITAANTNIPTAALAHRLARHFEAVLAR